MAIDFQDSTPLYVQIIKDIKAKITAGTLEAGEQLKSHKHLSNEYDVSLITIKSALSTLIDEGVLYSRVGKGTFVADKVISSNSTSHESIGLVLQDLKNPFFSPIAHSVEELAYKKNYNIMLSNSSSHSKKEANQIEHFKNMGVKGLIIASQGKQLHAPPIVRKLHEEEYPYVMISYVADEDIYYVGTDHQEGAYLGTKHLIELGHESVGYINSPVNNYLGDVRMLGYKRALNEANLNISESFILRSDIAVHTDGYDTGYYLGDTYHEMREKPTAFFAYNDLSAIGFIKRIQELGYSVPDDVAIVGFDDIEQAKYFNVPLTTVHQPMEKIGKAAIDILIRRIEGKKTPSQTILPSSLVVRESSGSPTSVAAEK